MEKEVQALLDALADLRERANVNAIFGDPVTAEGRTVIPVARVAYGFGLGMGGEMVAEEAAMGEPAQEPVEEPGAGGGGGVFAQPLAVIEVTSEGAVVKPVIDEQRLALAGGLLAAWAVFWLSRTLVKIFGPKA